MECAEQKAALRKEVFSRRDSILLEDRVRKSELICQRLLEELGPLEGKLVAVYQSMRSEVCLDSFIKKACAEGALLCYPCMMAIAESSARKIFPKQKSYMVFREVAPTHCLSGTIPFAENPMLAHKEGSDMVAGYRLVEAEELDAIVVPMVAFDGEFNRLGYGGGNYDSYLSEAHAHTRIIGVAFEEQRVAKIPCESHDHPLPLIISA